MGVWGLWECSGWGGVVVEGCGGVVIWVVELVSMVWGLVMVW